MSWSVSDLSGSADLISLQHPRQCRRVGFAGQSLNVNITSNAKGGAKKRSAELHTGLRSAGRSAGVLA